ncbi:MAG: hypothetical protein ACLFWB_06640 [Armatimonadota bacterium]
MKIGIANSIITPENPIWMTGFAARTEPSDGKYNDLEASVVVFESGDTRVGIMALDLVGIDEFFLVPIREKAAELGIEPEAMLVNCSHTHCGPAVRKVRGSIRKFDEEYLQWLQETLDGLLEEAVVDLQDAELDYSIAPCTLGINRRRKPEDDEPAGMLPTPEKPIDMDVPVLRVLSPDREVRAVLFSYACHPTTMGGQKLGTDFPGPARDVIRSDYETAVPIFLQGCGGDVKPRNIANRRFASGPLETVYEIGHELGRAVQAALCGTPEPLGDSLAASSAMADLPARDPMDEDEMRALENGNKWEKKWAKAARKTIEEHGELATVLPVEVQALNIGGLIICAMGGEICVGNGLELKQQFPDTKLWTLGYSNLLRCYVASRGEHADGGYEVERSFLYSWTPQPRPLGLKPESVDVLIDTAVEQIQAVR